MEITTIDQTIKNFQAKIKKFSIMTKIFFHEEQKLLSNNFLLSNSTTKII
jgi:hypothetical protein